MKKREKFKSRLGFILLSAGCAIGLGNVYRFPIITGAYGGAIFVLIYIAFLVLLGLPVMLTELAVGRGSQRSICTSFDVLEPQGKKWHLWKYAGVGGNYLLMMIYLVITGLMLNYFIKFCTGSIMSATTPDALSGVFGATISNPWILIAGAAVAIILGFLVCSFGLNNGVENVTKILMIVLFVLMIGLAVYSCTLPGVANGLKFYFVPSIENIEHAGIIKVIYSAMGQAFFTLSLGIGSIAIFGSYIGKERKLMGEATTIISLDTIVALLSGFIIFPAFFTFNDSLASAGEGGAGFVFNNFSAIFTNMPGGRIIGALFFLLLSFAAMSTVIAVFENIMSFWLEKTNLKRPVIALINAGMLLVLILPAVFSFNIWGDITVFGKNIGDLEDFIVSNLLLPIDSLIYVLFCTSKLGWGWNNFFTEINTGKQGSKFPRWFRPYMKYVLPIIIIVVLVLSIIPLG